MTEGFPCRAHPACRHPAAEHNGICARHRQLERLRELRRSRSMTARLLGLALESLADREPEAGA
jgi:hypothetical protein